MAVSVGENGSEGTKQNGSRVEVKEMESKVMERKGMEMGKLKKCKVNGNGIAK